MKTMFSHMFVAKYFDSGRNSVEAVMPWGESADLPKVQQEAQRERFDVVKRLQELRLKEYLTDEDLAEIKKLQEEAKKQNDTVKVTIETARTNRQASDAKTAQVANNLPAEHKDQALSAYNDERNQVVAGNIQAHTQVHEQTHDKVEQVKSTDILSDNKDLVTDEVKFKSIRWNEVQRELKEGKEKGNVFEGRAVQFIFADLDRDITTRKFININLIDVNNKLGVGQKFMASERQVLDVIENAPAAFDRFLRRITGAEAPYTVAQIYQAQEKFLSDLRGLRDAQYMITQRTTDLSVDIVKVLEGPQAMERYIEGVIRANQSRIQKNVSENVFQKGVEHLASMGVLIPAGLYYGRGEHRNLDNNSKGHPMELTLGNGRISAEAKATFLGIVAGLNLNDKENKLINDSDKFEEDLRALAPIRQNLDKVRAFAGPESKQLIDVFVKNPNIPEDHLIQALTYRDFVDRAEKLSGVSLKGLEAIFSFGGIRFGLNGSYLRVANVEVEDQSLRLQAIEGQEGRSGHVRATKLENGNYQYAVKSTNQNLIAEIKKAVPGIQVIEKDGFAIFETPAKLNISSYRDVNTKGAVTKSRVTIDNTPDKKEIIEQGSVKSKLSQDDLTRLDRSEKTTDVKITNRVYSLVRRDPSFDKIIVNISNGNYEQAFTALNEKYSDVAKLVTNSDGTYNVSKMQNLLTYTYGTPNPKNYKESRKEWVVRAENKVASRWAGADVKAQEAEFLKIPTHNQTDARTMFPNQHIVSSVVATPADLSGKKGARLGAGTDRIDHFDAPIQISHHTEDINNEAVKKAMIKSHSARVDSEVKRLSTALGINIAREEYETILLTGTIPPVEKFRGLKFIDGQEPKFKEARAMLHGNICNNLTYMLVFPNFEMKKYGERVITTQPVVRATIGAGSLAENVRYTEIGGGVGIGGDTPTDTPYTEPKPDARSITNTQTRVIHVDGGNIASTGIQSSAPTFVPNAANVVTNVAPTIY